MKVKKVEVFSMVQDSEIGVEEEKEREREKT